MIAGAFSKPCERVGMITWKVEDSLVQAILLKAEVHLPGNPEMPYAINLDEDLDWLEAKLQKLFDLACVYPPAYNIPIDIQND